MGIVNSNIQPEAQPGFLISGGQQKPRWDQAASDSRRQGRQSIPKKLGGGTDYKYSKLGRSGGMLPQFFYFWYTEMAFQAFWRHF